MSERGATVSHDQERPLSFCNLLLKTLQIFPRNKQAFFSIFALLTLPLSFLLSSLSFHSYPIKSRILHLESIASLAPTRVEARHVWKESREHALSLLRLKLLLSLPSYILSLLAAVTAVISAVSAYHKKPISVKAAFAAVKPVWTRPFTTSICIYVVLFLYSTVPRTLTALISGYNSPSGSKFVIWVVGSGLEVYLMAVLGMGLVVSIVEKRFGLDAIGVGSGLMEGRRVTGWVLSGFLAVVTGGIGWEMESLMEELDREDLPREYKWTVVMEDWRRVGLVFLYGMVVVWGLVVSSVFYCECRKGHAVREEVDGENGFDTL